MPNVFVIIPARNEELSIGKVVKDIPENIVKEIVVINNGSTDRTSEIAKTAGATVLDEPKKGYGHACSTGMEYLSKQTESDDILVFMDGDYSDYPEEITRLIAPMHEGYEMVIGSRVLGKREKG